METKLKNEMMEISIDDIRKNPHQPRKEFEEGKIKILAESIQEIGLNTPIELVWDKKDDGKKATLKDGERRFKALKIAGFDKLHYGKEFIIVDMKNDDEFEYRSLISCCMREDLQPSEKGNALFKILKRRGIENIDMGINVINRAKDYMDNDFIAEPSKRNFFIPKETVKQVAKDMKMIGVSGTNAVDLLKILKLPTDIKRKVFFAPPNSKIHHEKMKLNRHGKMVVRKNKREGELIPISFARELARLDDDNLIRFLLKNAVERSWTSRKLSLMVKDYLNKSIKPDEYIVNYKKSCKKSKGMVKNKREELKNLATTMDNMSSTLTSWRTINLISIADTFVQKEFAISGKGLLNSTTKLKKALEETLLTAKELQKVKDEEKEVVNVPFEVNLTTPPHQHTGFRFTIPKRIAEKLDAKVGDKIELEIKAVIK